MSNLIIESLIKESISDEDLDEIVDKAKDYAIQHGVCMCFKNNYDRNKVQLSRFVLVPTSFPKLEFEKGIVIQKILNKLIHKVAYDHDFISKTTKSVIEADNFTAELFKIYQTVYQEGITQKYSLGLFRSDYMLDDSLKIKQVELNTIASSFGGLSSQVTKLHKYILCELDNDDKINHLPDNETASGLADGLVAAWNIYDNNQGRILFVTEEKTCNICDQRAIEYLIREKNLKIKVIRRTFKYLIENAKLRPNKELIVGNDLVSVVYYRTGYEVEAYPTQNEWSVRLLIERSRAIKCPSIQYHLAGTKKVQQVLNNPKILKQFLNDEEARQIQDVFVGLYSLELNEEGDKAVEMAMNEPEKYVLKPQREGGGNNIYGENVKTTLENIKNSQERSAFILMELIKAPVQKNYIISPDNKRPQLQDCLSELGIYGYIIGDYNEIKENQQIGHVIRTKPCDENEGGIIAGAGALDSPYLYN
ncbi:hypothetical protein HCN44_011122 [Aphidius gifuensis]|uniref:Glutathione synthetase n=1 Tax=Aphidius gifuensis TaxID=684658 RepID=A0A834XUQ5_APHGI|nr:glutathione synthetase-like [Aphidius gifuensis]KAF7993853.1 hypothetical protein HCN44_011122 [Aphidius gifuensis]